MKTLLIAALCAVSLTLTGCMTQPDYRKQKGKPPTVQSVDLNKYAGKWFEIARYPNRFEKNCAGVTAEYIRDNAKEFTVRNTCLKGGMNGKVRIAEGTAKIVKGSNNSKLKVKFAPGWVPFASGDYWILHLEPNYSAALVGDPSGKYLWILARDRQISPATLARIRARADELGYNSSKLEMTDQG